MRRSGPIKGSDGSGNGICFSIKKDDIGAWSKLLGDEASALLHMSGTGPIDLDVSTFLGVIVYAAHPRVMIFFFCHLMNTTWPFFYTNTFF
jgi:hypothetical protein